MPTKAHFLHVLALALIATVVLMLAAMTLPLTGKNKYLTSGPTASVPGLDGQVNTTQGKKPIKSKQLKVFDADSSELGLLVGRNEYWKHWIYNEEVDKMFTLDLIGTAGAVQVRMEPYFTSCDCSGTAYLKLNDNERNRMTNDVLPVGPGRYYTVKKDAAKSTITFCSRLSWDENFDCLPRTGELIDARALDSLTLPFLEPVPMPLQYKVR